MIASGNAISPPHSQEEPDDCCGQRGGTGNAPPVELSIVRALNPPPDAISWLVTSVFWLGSAGVIALLVIVGLLIPRLHAVRWVALAGLLTWGVCVLLGALLGPAAGRPDVDALHGLNTGYPVTQLAVTIAVAATALPYLIRPATRLSCRFTGGTRPTRGCWRNCGASACTRTPGPRSFSTAVDPGTVAALRGQKDLLPRLREAIAAGAGIDVPKLAEVKRISWTNLVFAVGSLIGIWAIIGVLSDAGDAFEAIKGARWGWVALAFVLAQLPMLAEGLALLGSAVGDLPYGRCVALEVSNTFTVLVGGDVAVFAVRVRFFQRQGYDAEAAVSSGAIASTAWWTVKTVLFLIAIPFAAGSFHASEGSGGSNKTAVWIMLVCIIAAGIAAAVISLVPRIRAWSRPA